MADVFISYSKTRAAQAEELASELGDLGYDVWWDASLLPTGSFGAEIDRQLDAAKAVIVIWSPESVRSKWVRSEASHGDRQDKLVNTHTPDLNPAQQIPKPFDQTHSVGTDNIRAIVRALDALKVPRSRAGTAVIAAGSRRLKDLQERYRSEDRLRIDAEFIHGAPDSWFKPGAGMSEWFKDHEFGPEMVVVPAGSFMMGSPGMKRSARGARSWGNPAPSDGCATVRSRTSRHYTSTVRSVCSRHGP